MNRILLCLACWGLSLQASAQKVYFVYFQHESGKPFYLKMDEKIYSSASSGYLILSKLRDSTYHFTIGFPGSQGPELSYTLTIDKKDQGYLLKNFPEKGWGLFNLQSLMVIMPDMADKKEGASKKENTDASDFTNILAKAADDPSLKEKPVLPRAVDPPKPEKVAEKTPVSTDPQPVVVKTESKTEQIKPADPPRTEPVVEKNLAGNDQKEVVQPKQETGSLALTENPKETYPSLPAKDTVIKKEIAAAEPPKKEEPSTDPPSTIQLEKEKAVLTQNQVKDTSAGHTETVKTDAAAKTATEQTTIIADKQEMAEDQLPSYKPSVVSRRSESSTTEGFGLTFIDLSADGEADTIRILIPNPKQVVVPVTKKDEPKEEPKFIETVSTDTTGQKAEKKSEPVPAAVSGILNRNCNSMADDNDFLKLRKRMAGESGDDGMIAEAKKIFKGKCFSVLQVKNLGTLFLADEGRYRFYDMAYPYVSDPGNFASLEAEIKDPYYVNRFRAMLRQ